jgi:hypothetical protein
MASPTTSRTGHRFLGNKNKHEVHDQQREDRSSSGCQIDEILRAGHGVYFVPDTLEQARREGYDNCAKCLGGSRR